MFASNSKNQHYFFEKISNQSGLEPEKGAANGRNNFKKQLILGFEGSNRVYTLYLLHYFSTFSPL